MTEAKFKLKKNGNGKTVGLLKIENGAAWTTVSVRDHSGILVGFDPSWDSAWCIGSDGLQPTIDFDSIHPFVCLDRNGVEVYEGDKVDLAPFVMQDVCIAAYHPEVGQWWFENDERTDELELGISGRCEYIELIPDEQG